MILELNEIKALRKKLNITQQELAARAGLSQSLIAKIESDRIDPSYRNAVKIFNALNRADTENNAPAEQLMKKGVISVEPDGNLSRAIERMKKHGISQLPVIEKGKVIGLVSESIILDALLERKGTVVREVMGEPPPIVSRQTNVKAVSQLLRYCPIVLVSEKGKLKGVITKVDTLTKL